MDSSNPENPKALNSTDPDLGPEDAQATSQPECNAIAIIIDIKPQEKAEYPNPSTFQDEDSTLTEDLSKPEVKDFLITDIDPNDNTILDETPLPNSPSFGHVLVPVQTHEISDPSTNKTKPGHNVEILLKKEVDKYKRLTKKKGQGKPIVYSNLPTDRPVKMSPKVFASFVDWNRENDPSSDADVQEVEKVSEMENQPPRFDLTRSHTSDEDDNYTGFWTPDTEKYWSLQYSDTFKSLPSTEGTINNNFVVEMGQGSNGQGPEDKIRNGNAGNRAQPPPQRRYQATAEPMNRALNWLYSTIPHPMDEEFSNPQFRARFSALVLLAKAIQCLIIWGSLIGLQFWEAIAVYHQNSIYLAYLCLVCYIFLFIILRGSLLGESQRGSWICFVLMTFCLIEVFASLQFNTSQIVICGIVLILGLTFLVLSGLCCSLKMDVVDNTNVFSLAVTVVLLITVSAFVVTFAISPTPTPSLSSAVRKIGGIFVPVLMSCESMILMELSELYQILRGFRLPLFKSEWIRAAAYLF